MPAKSFSSARGGGVTEEQSIESRAPTILAETPGRPSCGAMRGVDAPADSGFLDPGANNLEIGLGQIEIPLQRDRLENVQDAARREAALGGFENAQEGVDRRRSRLVPRDRRC